MSDLPLPRSRPAAVPSSEQGTPVSSDVDNSPNNVAQQAADPEDDDDDDEDLDEDGEGDDDDEEDAEGDDDEEEEEEAQDEEMEYISPTEDEDNEDDDDDDEDDADFDPTAEVDPRTSTAQPAAVDADVELDLLGTLEGPSNAGGLPAKARSRGPIKIKVKLDKKAVLAVTPSGTGAGAVKAVGSRAKGKAPAKGKAAAGGRGRTKARATGTSSGSRKSSKRKLSAGESGDELDDEGEEDLDGAGDEDGEGEEEEGSDSSEDFSNLDPELSYSRTTMRQLAKEDQRLAGDLIALPLKDESRKKQLSEAEQALRKSEMARRRRNQTEKKLEDDKTETINRLLKKQVSRSRSKLGAEGADGGEAGTPTTTDLTSQTSAGRRVGGVTKEMQAENKKFARPLFRYISNAGGATVSVPMHKERGVVDGKARNEYERRWSEVFGSGVKRAKIEVVGGGREGGGG
ncbi:hypothetical protein A4X13_0g3703 [Tilletia indica]|uniref:INO80 complex subunit B-like conserved region domain-containing protein n=1 Tax=Tilletia indica TaxID=43049 RepID=A0A177TE18_9BASI|nr:hypothetical protein A4X13_0g3703 [Tilletia indica]